MIAATIACAAAGIVLLLAEIGGWRVTRAAAKLAASSAFCAVGVLAACAAPPALRAQFAPWIVIGLGWGAIGDLALLGRGRVPFLIGLTAFLIGHLAYVIAIGGVLPPWSATWALIGVPSLAGAIALRWLSPHVRGAMRLPVAAYVTVIVAMVGLALVAASNPALPAPLRTRLALAAVAFFASDLAVARERFVAPALVNKLWGLPVYYAAQLLFAWSIAS